MFPQWVRSGIDYSLSPVGWSRWSGCHGALSEWFSPVAVRREDVNCNVTISSRTDQSQSVYYGRPCSRSNPGVPVVITGPGTALWTTVDCGLGRCTGGHSSGEACHVTVCVDMAGSARKQLVKSRHKNTIKTIHCSTLISRTDLQRKMSNACEPDSNLVWKFRSGVLKTVEFYELWVSSSSAQTYVNRNRQNLLNWYSTSATSHPDLLFPQQQDRI
ncbi:hypothetical protein RRG08_061536 [Elysia crispata]|uniref:Uncharacterized protein n=1 Tax=Elysia crispata TaxID=231223 RepID=A0AAE1API7_9GAST|nr:hypothetical protein RRG08_061536 [Elysia crispata]